MMVQGINSRSVLLLTTALAACFATATQAVAQDAPAPDAAQAKAETSPDIVVTGERANQYGTDVVQSGSFRNAKILDVPMTIAVVPAAELKAQQAVDLIDAVRNTAGVGTAGVGPVAYNNLTIRGISVDTTSSYKLDGALNILSSTAFPLEDKDRVEVLKGASALYYGFSPPSGIINLVMKRPTPDLTFYENTFGDSHGGVGQHVDIGDTVGPFGFRLNGVAAHLDTGIRYATGDRYLTAGSFDLKPVRGLTLTADVEYFEKSIVEPALFLIPNGAAAIPNVKLLDPHTNIGGANWDVNHTEEFNVLGKAVYKFSEDWNVSAYYGRSHLLRLRNSPQFQPSNTTTSFDPSSPDYGAGRVRFSAQNTGYTNYNYAAELAGTIRLGAFRNEVLLGASRAIRYLASSKNVRTYFDQNFADPVYIPNPQLTRTLRPSPSRVNDKGIYLFDRLSFHDIVQVLGGIRKSDYSNDGSINVSTKTPYHVKPTAYSAGFVVKPQKWVSLYGTYIEGLEENSIATDKTDNAYQVFPPISSKMYEAGIKLQPRHNLLVQLAYFDIRRDGAENERPGPDTPTNGLLHAYGDANQQFKGFEASVTGYVFRDLAVSASFTDLSAHYRDHPAVSAGHRIEGTPKTTWSLFGDYTVSWLDPGLKLTGGIYHTGSQALDATNNVVIAPYTTFDLGAAYTFLMGEHELTARVTGQNIAGKRYWGTVSNGTLAPGLPGEVKFSLSFSY